MSYKFISGALQSIACIIWISRIPPRFQKDPKIIIPRLSNVPTTVVTREAQSLSFIHRSYIFFSNSWVQCYPSQSPYMPTYPIHTNQPSLPIAIHNQEQGPRGIMILSTFVTQRGERSAACCVIAVRQNSLPFGPQRCIPITHVSLNSIFFTRFESSGPIGRREPGTP